MNLDVSIILGSVLISLIGFIFWIFYLNKRQRLKIEAAEARRIELLQEWWGIEYTEFLTQIKSPLCASPFRMNPEYGLRSGIILNNKEQILIHTPCILSRTVKTGIKYSGGTKGVRITPVKGISFNIGASKGRAGGEYQNQMEVGYLTLTSKRIIFTGDDIQFAVELTKVGNISIDGFNMIVDLKSRDVPDFTAIFLSDIPAKLFTILYSDPKAGIDLNFINT